MIFEAFFAGIDIDNEKNQSAEIGLRGETIYGR
jgi:hypothetical protein